MYQILNLSPGEDNECAISQAFSCRRVVLGVYVCLCAHVSAQTEEEKAWCLCFSHELVWFGWTGVLR